MDGFLKRGMTKASALATLLGVGVGGALARFRAPLFPDLLDLSGPEPSEAAFTRAAGLVAAALLVFAAGPVVRRAPGALLAGATAGVATSLLDPLDGGLLVGVAPPWLVACPWFALAAIVAFVARRQLGSYASSRVEDGAPATSPALLAGVLISASGATLGLEGLARLALRLGLATRGEDALLATVLMALLTTGGLIFGRPALRGGASRCAGAALGAATLSLVALALAAGIAEPLGFKALCARIHADASLAGTPTVGAFVALVVLLLPALAAGATLHLTRRPAAMAAVLLGAAIAVAAAPGLLAADPLASILGAGPGSGSAGLVRLGAIIGGAGTLLHVALHREGPRLALGGAGLGVMLGAAGLPVRPVPVLHPWEPFPVEPLVVFETVDGQFIVDPTGRGRRRASLDQRPLSPRARGLAGEAARLRASVEAVGPAPVRRILFVGLLTPERAQTLTTLGIGHVDRTAGWWRSMALVEAAVGTDQVGMPGEVLSRKVARQRAWAGDYDLVLAPGTGASGPLPASLGLRLGDGATPIIAWRKADRMARHLPWSATLLRATDGLLTTSMAWTAGEVFGTERPTEAGATVSRWEWLRLKPEDRARLATAEAEVRISRSWTASSVDRAVAWHALTQAPSSPFESAIEQVELSDASLDLLREGAVGSPALSPFDRGVIEDAARVLTEKRLVPEVVRFAGPIAEAHPGWPALERALARADLEELNPEAALARLEALTRGPTGQGAAPVAEHRDTALLRTAALLELDRPADAAAALRTMAQARPGDLELSLRLADALVAAGDPEGRQLAARLYAEHPGHPELFGLAQGKRGMTSLDPDPSRRDGR
ncbi:MAG: hypothetical protein P8M11_10670 [Planctomycetota bacterium]|nr:hypothetical protein [Planctomycetota bacterium]